MSMSIRVRSNMGDTVSDSSTSGGMEACTPSKFMCELSGLLLPEDDGLNNSMSSSLLPIILLLLLADSIISVPVGTKVRDLYFLGVSSLPSLGL